MNRTDVVWVILIIIGFALLASNMLMRPNVTFITPVTTTKTMVVGATTTSTWTWTDFKDVTETKTSTWTSMVEKTVEGHWNKTVLNPEIADRVLKWVSLTLNNTETSGLKLTKYGSFNLGLGGFTLTNLVFNSTDVRNPFSLRIGQINAETQGNYYIITITDAFGRGQLTNIEGRDLLLEIDLPKVTLRVPISPPQTSILPP